MKNNKIKSHTFDHFTEMTQGWTKIEELLNIATCDCDLGTFDNTLIYTLALGSINKCLYNRSAISLAIEIVYRLTKNNGLRKMIDKEFE